jgi:hypothetical protein
MACAQKDEPNSRLKPLSVRVDQGNKTNGRTADLRRKRYKVIELCFRRSVENLQIGENLTALLLVCGSERRVHSMNSTYGTFRQSVRGGGFVLLTRCFNIFHAAVPADNIPVGIKARCSARPLPPHMFTVKDTIPNIDLAPIAPRIGNCSHGRLNVFRMNRLQPFVLR